MAEQPGCAWDRVTKYLERACVEENVRDWPTALIARPPGYLRSASMWWTDAEVMNGGFQQYFLNSTNEVVWHAIAGYERLHENQMAGIVRSAALACMLQRPALLRAPAPTKAFVNFEPRAHEFDDLNKRYDDERDRLPTANGIPNGANLCGLVEYYWKQHPEDFREPAAAGA